ncbi:conserved hypothetical protein, membrane [Candidatus Magnetomorum sp. HK-1]|nr:conserved hypothetical protein, membrane [Candidatus Magnetomorum sp. HK-1]
MNKSETFRMPSKNWQKLYVPMGVVTFFFALTFFWYFVQKWRFIDFWSFHWNFSIISILGCMSASYGFVKIGQNNLLQRFFLFGFGISSFAFSTFLFVSWGVTQILGIVSIYQYLGYFAIFILFTASAILAFINISSDFLRYPSYFFGLANIMYICLLISKYIFKKIPYGWIFFIDSHIMQKGALNVADSYTWYIFIGEVIILLLGEVVFWALLFNGIGDPFEDNL